MRVYNPPAQISFNCVSRFVLLAILPSFNLFSILKVAKEAIIIDIIIYIYILYIYISNPGKKFHRLTTDPWPSRLPFSFSLPKSLIFFLFGKTHRKSRTVVLFREENLILRVKVL